MEYSILKELNVIDTLEKIRSLKKKLDNIDQQLVNNYEYIRVLKGSKAFPSDHPCCLTHRPVRSRQAHNRAR